ncbi:TetR/AcrR family transcriptional regulator [Sphingomonas profundi]|uniref:TetR/AcrR family transcriptional regulator n=1 Tax=Alterirhizorhabdus profundi TaxID=2681549 RepID=UPI0012E93DB8|nr:TetR/AcrR family transcriptional regulator [Sphingomonas profundi]
MIFVYRLPPGSLDRTIVTRESGISKRRVAAKKDSSASYVARRQEIADAAIRVFHKMGLERASMSAVAEELGIDRASLYYYASSKEVLFDECVRTVVERNLALVKRIEASRVSPRRKLRDLIIALMSSYGEYYPVFYIYIRENLSQVSEGRTEWSRDMRGLNRQTTDAVISIIEQGYADGSFRNVGPARVVAYGVLGIVGWTHRWFRPDQSAESASEIGKIYAELFLAGIESPY